MIAHFKIRPAGLQDAEAVFHCIGELEETDFDYALFTIFYTEILSGKDNLYLVAETEEGTIAGYISAHGQMLLHHLAKVFEIQELFVKKEYRGQEIGRLLLQTLEAVLLKKGIACWKLPPTKKEKRRIRFTKAMALFVRITSLTKSCSQAANTGIEPNTLPNEFSSRQT